MRRLGLIAAVAFLAFLGASPTPVGQDPDTGAFVTLPLIPEANGGFGQAAPSGTGLLARIGTASYAVRTLQAGANVSITSPDGVAGNPVISATFAAGSIIYQNPVGNAVGGLLLGGTCYLTSPGVACSGTEIFLVPADRPGTARNLRCFVAAGPGLGRTAVFTVRQNGVNTAMTCSLLNAATSCTDLAHTFPVSANDLFSISDAEPLLSGTARPLCGFVVTN